MRLFATLALSCLMLSSTPAFAKDEKPENPDKKICRRYATTGSILGGKPQCHTRAEWETIDRENSDAVRRTAARVTLNPTTR
jgi:hypothetical protein